MEVTEEQIDATARLLSQGKFKEALGQFQEMLRNVVDPPTRMLLLFHIISCSTQIEAGDVTARAMVELEKFPSPEMSRALANLTRANAEIDLGRPQNALAILEMCLEADFFDKEDFRVHKYRLYFLRGKALERLQRWREALDWLDRAHAMFPNAESCPDEDARKIFGWVETEILFNKARSMGGLNRHGEAYELSRQAFEREQGDTQTLAVMYMAYSLVMLRRFSEALKLYTEVEQKLPCRLIKVEDLTICITLCVDESSKQKPGFKLG
jgi:tetratricopeptide (TPR) repeat protein